MTTEEAYDTYADTVYRFFYTQCFDRHVAEDLTSQTFMVFVERKHDDSYVIADTKKFLYGVMRNVWLVYLRHKYRHAEHAMEDIDDFEAYVDEHIEDYGSKTIKQRAEVYINRLPDKQREIVTYRLLEELSIKDICAVTGKDSNYVKTTYKRGVKRLRELIATAPIAEEVL